MSQLCKAKYRWTREEVRRGMLNHQRVNLRRPVRIFTKVFAVLLLIFLAAVVVAWLYFPSTSGLPVFPLALLALFCIYWLMFDRLNAWYWGRSFAKRPDANVQIEWQFSTEGVRAETELGQSVLYWKGFLRVVETNEGFLFYTLKNVFHWVPFSAFDSGDCVEMVRRLIRENNVPSKGRPPTKRSN